MFEGWGCDDQELACRLISRHGFSISCPSNLEVLHLENDDPAGFRHLRPRNSTEIEAYIRNLVYFCRRYPDIDMFLAWYSLRLYEFDAQSCRWIPAEIQTMDQTLLHRRIRDAYLWYDSLPDRR